MVTLAEVKRQTARLRVIEKSAQKSIEAMREEIRKRKSETKELFMISGFME